MNLQLRHRVWQAGDPPLIMGILNVTPDSFSDGGRYFARDRAVEHATQMIEAGAAIIDVGPESTRPGAAPVSANEQIDRACPAIEAIRQQHKNITVSIDTRLASVAKEAIRVGADMVNDVSALEGDPDMARVVAKAKVPVVLMHMNGTPETMQRGGGPEYQDVIKEIIAYLEGRCRFAHDADIEPSNMIVDPGIGFGKRVQHNLLILRHLERFVACNRPVLLGVSRKSFLEQDPKTHNPSDRDAASIAYAVLAAQAGVAILRVHEVLGTATALGTWLAIAQGAAPCSGSPSA